MSTTFMGITLNLQKKYNKMNELQDVTKQMAEALQRNDLYAVQLLMEMRTEVMLEIDDIDYAREDLLKCLPANQESLVREALSTKTTEQQLANADLQRMNDIYKKTARNLEVTIQYDKAINMKMAGDHSFYKK